MGNRAELAQSRIRGERHLVPRANRLQVDERQRRASVVNAGLVVSQRHLAGGSAAAVQLRWRPDRCPGAGLLREYVPELLEGAQLRDPSPDGPGRSADAGWTGCNADRLQLRDG